MTEEKQILKQINDPTDLRRLNIEELTVLAEEVRQSILQVIAENGGHLASNLGAVELTLAVHYVFDTPHDLVVWDVGHQCYAHKLITGRRERFTTIRTAQGLSGFCNAEESEYDCFTTGHASNSLSLALGLASARDIKGEKRHVVAIIGDGALTGGMAFEALDHGGELQSPLIVIVNDNKMSIAANVGALARHLMKLRAAPAYHRAKRDVDACLQKIPGIGGFIATILRKIKAAGKYLISRGILFEELGYVYLGPIDGHDLPQLIEILEVAKGSDRPVVVHVRTCKGKGYAPAEQNPSRFHGASPFFLDSGYTKTNKQATFTDVFSDTLLEIASQDDRVCAVTAAMADGAGLKDFAKAFPQRFFDVGIAEQHALSFAAGLAKGGMKPVVAIYSTFLQRAYDQVMEDICLQRLPVVLAVDRAGVVGEDGYSHQGLYDLSYLRSIPGLTVMAPRDGAELQMMLKTAVTWKRPVAIRYPRDKADWGLPLPAPLCFGKGELLREGHDVALLSCGVMSAAAMAAAAILQRQGVKAAVFNCRFVSPLDEAGIKSLTADCGGRVAVIEDNIIAGGFGESCAVLLQEQKADLLFISLPKSFIAQGSRDKILENYGLQGEKIAESVFGKWFQS